jgi:acylphosphatase
MSTQRNYYRMTGRVQNVGFRWTVRQLAESLGLTGRVRNRRDGSVEMELQGSPAALNKLIKNLVEEQTFIRIDDTYSEPLPLVDDEKGLTVRF